MNKDSNQTSKRSKSAFPPAVVIPADRPASLGIARSLGRRGIKVYEVDTDANAIGMASRYVTPRPIPSADGSDEQRLEYLLRLGKELGEAVLYPLRDNDVLLCSKYRAELQPYYRYVMSDHETMTNVLTKDGLHKIAAKYNIPSPRVIWANSLEEIEQIGDRLPFPVVLKPVFSPSWLQDDIAAIVREDHLSGPSKVVFCPDINRLLEMYKKISVYDPRMIIEEYIPGEDSSLLYFCFYLNRQSRILASFAGIKERILPVGFGSATFVRSFYDSKLEEASLELLSAVEYKGLGGVEFKRDSRDDTFKLIEFNARLGMWDSYGARCGVDIPYVSYQDALGLKVEPEFQYRNGVRWIDFQRDVRAFIIYRKRGKLTFWRWLRSLIGEKEWAFFEWDDWKPAWISFLQLVNRQRKGSQTRPTSAEEKRIGVQE